MAVKSQNDDYLIEQNHKVQVTAPKVEECFLKQ
jgi:hypothetical protein